MASVSSTAELVEVDKHLPDHTVYCEDVPNEYVEKGNTRLQYIASCSATLSYTVVGTFVGWASPSMEKLTGEDSHIPLKEGEAAWIIAVISCGVLVAPLPTSYVIDRLGRKPTILFTALPFIVSWLMIIFATTTPELYASRFLAGIGIGVVLTAGPIYMGEIAEDKVRGTLGTIFQFMMNFGTLFGFCLGPYISFKLNGIISLIFPVLFLITFIWMPESPYFLMARNRRNDAEKSLMRLRGVTRPESIREELSKIQVTVEVQAKEKGSIRDLFGSSENIKAMLLAVFLMLTQTYSGIGPILSSSTMIFEKSGSTMDSSIATIILGVVQLVISVVSPGFVDKKGRRPLLLISLVGCSVSLIMEGVYFYLDQHNKDASASLHWMPLTFLLLYIITYTIGLGPLPWTIAGEIFPNNVKSLSVSFVCMANAFGGFTSIKVFDVIANDVGHYVGFWTLSAWCLMAIIILWIVLPETKGKSFLQISQEMKTSKFAKKETDGMNGTR